MLVVIEGSSGFTVANNGEVVARNLTRAEAEQWHQELGNSLRTVSAAVTPAKAIQRMRPPIMCYPVKSAP